MIKYIFLYWFLSFFPFNDACFAQALVSKPAFQKSPNSVKVHAWWHWVDNAITKEGITKDLMSMKAQMLKVF